MESLRLRNTNKTQTWHVEKKKEREIKKKKEYKTVKRTERFPTREWQLDQQQAYQQVNGNQTRE